MTRKRMETDRSGELYKRALRVMVGGVSSPVRAFKSVGGTPLFIVRGKGPRIWDADGNSFLDLVLSWGPLIAGHAHPKVVRAVILAVKNGTSFGAPSEVELKLAEEVCSSVPSMELTRFVSSGTEATMSAIRVARAYTKRRKFLKFDGCYHGHSDPFLSQGGSGLATFDIPVSAGVSEEQVSDTLTVPYNDIDAVRDAFARHGSDLSAVIVEPVAGNMGVIPPEPGFLESLREMCTKNRSLLVFDEVITGFRVARGGAQSMFHVSPDITCLGKILGGGFPVGAYGGKREIMQLVSPVGPVYQAGTLSGNPVAMTAGLATLSLLDGKGYGKLEKLSSTLERGLHEAAEEAQVAVKINRIGSMMGIFFTDVPPRNFGEVKNTNHRVYAKFHRAMLESGIYLPPSPFETIFISTTHTVGDIERIVQAAKGAFIDCTTL